MNHLIRLILAVVIFIAILLITAPLKVIFCIWDWKWEAENYFDSIFDITSDVVGFDS